MKTVYVETSIISYLTALPARDLLAAAWQNATSRWWETRRHHFEVFTSQLVIAEAGEGNPAAANAGCSVWPALLICPCRMP